MFQAGVRHSRQKSAAHLSALGDLPATRARPDILPEHESRWPVTDEVRAAIEADWDGSGGSARDLGQRFHSPMDGSTYPSWRIADIAQQMGVYAAKVSARVQANVDELYPEPPAPHGKQPHRQAEHSQAEHNSPTGITTLAAALERVDTQLADGAGDTGILAVEREVLADLMVERSGQAAQAITEPIETKNAKEAVMTAQPKPETAPLICERCGQEYSPWRFMRGKPVSMKICLTCFKAQMRSTLGQQTPAAITPTPAPEPTPVTPTDVRISMATPITPAVAAAISAEAVRVAAGPDLPTPAVTALPVPIPAAPALPPAKGIDAIPGLLVATLRRLPATREWTTRERERWVALFAAALDYEITVTDEDEGE